MQLPPHETALAVPVDSPAFQFSPGTWRGDVGRGGSAWRQSWNNGSWFTLSWSTASRSPRAVIGADVAGNAIRVFLSKNGAGETVGTLLDLTPMLTGAGSYVARVFLDGSEQFDRWAENAVSATRITRAMLDPGATPGTARAALPWGLFVGDSITEGILTSGATYGYSHLVGEALRADGYEYAVSACGYSGWLQTGDGYDNGDVPKYYAVSGSVNGAGGTYNDAESRWDKISQGVSLLDSEGRISAYGETGTAPAWIYINYGTNDALSGITGNAQGQSDLRAAVTQGMTALRAAAPGAVLMIGIPFGQFATADISAGYDAYVAANPADDKVFLLDLGAPFAAALSDAHPSDVHPTDAEHAEIARLLTPRIRERLEPFATQRIRPGG